MTAYPENNSNVFTPLSEQMEEERKQTFLIAALEIKAITVDLVNRLSPKLIQMHKEVGTNVTEKLHLSPP